MILHVPFSLRGGGGGGLLFFDPEINLRLDVAGSLVRVECGEPGHYLDLGKQVGFQLGILSLISWIAFGFPYLMSFDH